MSEVDSTLECALCGMRSNNLATHITRTHKISCDEYKKVYNLPVMKHTAATKTHLSSKKIKPESKHQKTIKISLQNQSEVSHLEPLKCRLCEFTSGLSLIAHVTRIHRISMSEYRKTWPDDTVQRTSKSIREKVSSSVKEWYKSDENYQKVLKTRSFPSELKHWTRKGFDIETAKQKVAEFQSKISLRGNNERTRILRSEKMKGAKNISSLKSIAQRKNCSITEARKHTTCWGRKGKKHPMWGKRHPPEVLWLIANAHHLKNPSHRSKGEIELAEFCTQLQSHVEFNKNIDRYNVDILFEDKRVIIEYFGDFWHMNPIQWNESDVNPVTGFLAKFTWDRDATKVKRLSDLNYNVISIWEHDWKCNRTDCEERIKKCLL